MEVDLSACLRGDKDAWDAFVDRFAGVIYAAVHRCVQSSSGASLGSDVDDVSQDVFARLVKDDYRLLRRFDPSKAALPTYLTLVARSVALDHLRSTRKRGTVALPDDIAAPDEVGPERADEHEPPPLHILSPRQRLVLELLFERDLTVPQAASLLEVDEQTVRSTKHKAITRLREHFADAPESRRDGDDSTRNLV